MIVDMTERLFTREEVAELFKVDLRTIDRWRKNGKLKVIASPGRVVRITESELRRLGIVTNTSPTVLDAKQLPY